MLRTLSSQPLRAIGLSDIVKWVSASGEGSDGVKLPPPETQLEKIIDIQHHPYAQTHVARATLKRLAGDVEPYARDQGKATLPQLVGLTPAEMHKGICDAAAGDRGGLLRAAPLEGAVGKLESLIRKLHGLRREDAEGSARGVVAALGAANCEAHEKSCRAELGFALRRLAGEEATPGPPSPYPGLDPSPNPEQARRRRWGYRCSRRSCSRARRTSK
jgi:hypothetical protein